MSFAKGSPRATGAELPGERDALAFASLEFSVDIVPDQEQVRVSPAGEVDIATADQLRQPIAELLEAGYRRVVVDLRQVTFLDSTGVHTLIQCHERARDRGASMSIILGGPATRRVLDITGIIDHLQIERSRDLDG
jgi:anti-anti-sigma factor